MIEPLQSTIQFPVRKRATPSRRKIVDNAEDEKENSPTKKSQIEETPKKISTAIRTRRRTKISDKMELESIIKTLKLSSPKSEKGPESPNKEEEIVIPSEPQPKPFPISTETPKRISTETRTRRRRTKISDKMELESVTKTLELSSPKSKKGPESTKKKDEEIVIRSESQQVEPKPNSISVETPEKISTETHTRRRRRTKTSEKMELESVTKTLELSSPKSEKGLESPKEEIVVRCEPQPVEPKPSSISMETPEKISTETHTRRRRTKTSEKMELESKTLEPSSPKPEKGSESRKKEEFVVRSESRPVEPEPPKSKPSGEKSGASLVTESEVSVVPTKVDYKKTKQALHTSIPDWLVGREAESREIESFLREHLENGTPGSVYISGAPGTGKTAVLMKTIEAIQVPCQKVVINCMTHKNSQSIFNAIRSSLAESDGPGRVGTKKGSSSSSSSSSSARDAMADIEDRVTSSGLPVLMVFDEIDSLDSRNQEVLYTIFEWPALEGSRLVLAGVANSLDLTDRVLPRLLSRQRCKPRLINFPPYTSEEIAKIILERLAKLGPGSAMDPLSVHFCAKKLSSMSGDLRMALDVCRRSVDVMEMEEKKNPSNADDPNHKPKKVGLSIIQKVVNEVYGRKAVSKNESRVTIPLQQMLAVCTLLLMGKVKKYSKEVNFSTFHENYAKICTRNGIAGVERSEFLGLCVSMQDQGLLDVKKAKEVRLYKVSLRINENELEHAIQDKTLLSTVLAKGLDS